MSNIKIETLLPVHIGSGELLQNNTDFVVETNGEESCIHIVDAEKIFQLIGEQNIGKWLASIEKKESTADLVKRLSPKSTYKDYSKRSMDCFAKNVWPDTTLKEVIHNGMGLPYIPGSSIKGAIRTAVLSSLASGIPVNELQEAIELKDKKTSNAKFDKFGNKMLSARALEETLFGKDPNHDLFRFIRVGDAHFDKNSLIATRMVNLNIRKNRDNLMDGKNPQLIEAISAGQESSFQLNIAKDYYDRIKGNFSSLGTLKNEMSNVRNLFLLINNHTRELVETEIDFWEDIDKFGGEDYIEDLKTLLEEINSCEEGKSCVLRIGHGSGWRFITGAWTERLDNFYPDIPNAARPKNHIYSEYDFPKSRRVDEDCEALGFVRLTLE